MNTKSLRNIFLILFVVSTVFVFMLSFGAIGNSNAPAVIETPEGTEAPAVGPTAEPGEPSESSHEPSGSMNSSAVIGSILTSVTSLIGFITTTVITWRKEKRESSLADMERRKLETELEKSRLELEELKKKSEKKEVKRKTSKK